LERSKTGNILTYWLTLEGEDRVRDFLVVIGQKCLSGSVGSGCVGVCKDGNVLVDDGLSRSLRQAVAGTVAIAPVAPAVVPSSKRASKSGACEGKGSGDE